MKYRLFRPRKKEFVRTDGQDTIAMKLTWKPNKVLPRILNSVTGVKFGEGKSTSISCALARPYRELLENGKPIGKINYIFFKVNKWPSHILGSLCFTPGHRILFFPGLVERKINWFYSKKNFQSIKSIGFADHLTLEAGFRRWHITVLEDDGTKKLLMPSFNTKRIEGNALFWFGLTIQGPTVLETTPEELTLVFPSPPKDSDRRITLLLDARKNAIMHLTTLNRTSLSREEFLHFDFFIGPADLTLEKLPCNVPTQKPIVNDYRQAFKEGTHFRSHPVSLEGMTERIWVVASKHIGKVSDKAIFACL